MMSSLPVRFARTLRAPDTPRHRFHAWVEHQGRVIAGDDADGFVALA